ncbi:MAG: sugar phosphate nucleotidyltransferase [Nitrososphaerota archaeon]|nr:sugar phosphate nucleotidyltransferase [Candidatus Calditenuaceae archaeon]MDW8073796.1 sugar phosphate nucleotidyltransferase [Nitrososphaerota archaeon]
MRVGELKAVLPIAGLGTRMLPATKEQPKEMLPVFAKSENGSLCVKPIIQLIFEQLFDVGIRQFIMVVGRGKRAVEDHFTPDQGFLEIIRRSRSPLLGDFEAFYRRVNESTLVWVNQPHPLGFGHAVLLCESAVGVSPFIVHAGDTYIVNGAEVIERMFKRFEEGGAEVMLLLQEVEDPRQYGVAEVSEVGGRLMVRRVEEKPSEPRSNLVIVPLYIFRPSLFDALRLVKPGVGGELQLTDGIQKLIDRGYRVEAVKLGDGLKMDVGSPQLYWEALQLSYSLSSKP